MINLGRLDQEMSEEMRFHIDARAADLERRGMPPAEAARQARLEFGGVERYKDEGRRARGLAFFDRLTVDLRFAFRSLSHARTLAAIAIVTLALGIGANAVVFSAVNSILLKPLAYRDPQRIYSVRTVIPSFARLYPDLPVNAFHLDTWRRQCSSLESLSIIGAASFNLSAGGEPERVDGLFVSSSFFEVLDVHLPLGRTFTEVEDRPNANRVIVVSDALWRRQFAASPAVLGRKVMWDKTPVEIIGVLPADFHFPKGEEMGTIVKLANRIDVLRPAGIDPAASRKGQYFNDAGIAKLKPGRTVDQALAEMNQVLTESGEEFKLDMRAKLLPLQERMTGSVRGPLWLLMCAAGALLLIVCVNLGNLMMAQAAGRHRDWAIRAALGASRADLFRQALIESLALAVTGGALATALAFVALRLLPRIAPPTLPRFDEIALDWRVLLFTLLISTAAGALCSLAPLWRMLRADPQEALRAGSPRMTETGIERRARHTLVSVEAGLSLTLAAAAGLLIVSLVRVLDTDKGFQAERVLTFQLALPGSRYAKDRRDQFHAELLTRLRSEPGVISAGVTSYLPLQGEMWIGPIKRKGETRHYSESPSANHRFISPGYLEAMNTRIIRGRGFEEADRRRSVALLSETAARKVFRNEDPIGQAIQKNGEDGVLIEIIGIVADVKTTDLEAASPSMVYLPYWTEHRAEMAYVLRSSAHDSTLIPRIRAAVASLDRELPMHQVRTMSEIVDSSVAMRRLQTILAAAFAGAGVLLACLGVFGVVSYGVARRTGEIGVRMALGAARSEVVAMVVKESMRPVLLGLAGGLAASLALGSYLASQLYGVSPRDPIVLSSIALIVTLAALAASYWPARRAANIEPVRALRWE